MEEAEAEAVTKMYAEANVLKSSVDSGASESIPLLIKASHGESVLKNVSSIIAAGLNEKRKEISEAEYTDDEGYGDDNYPNQEQPLGTPFEFSFHVSSPKFGTTFIFVDTGAPTSGKKIGRYNLSSNKKRRHPIPGPGKGAYAGESYANQLRQRKYWDNAALGSKKLLSIFSIQGTGRRCPRPDSHATENSIFERIQTEERE